MKKMNVVLSSILVFGLTTAAQASDLHWSKDVKTAIQAAAKSKQLIMLDFTAKW